MEKPKGSLISYFSNLVKKHGGINLAQGRPGFCPPPELLRILQEAVDNRDLHQYAPGNGDFDLLELLAERYGRFAPITSDHLLVVNGATEGLSLTFHYLNTILPRPCSVLSFDPVYESYPMLARIFGLPFAYFDMDPTTMQVDFDALERTIQREKVGVVFLSSPGNPLGKVWSEREIANLVDLSRTYRFYIVFDAVYEHIYLESPPCNPLPLQCDRLFFVSSFSKMLSITGWRIGYVIASEEHMERIRAIHDYTGLSAPFLLQKAIFRYLSASHAVDGYLQELRNRWRDNYELLRETLVRLDFFVPAIQGGYFLWAGLPKRYPDAWQFAVDLYRNARVGVVPGENFSERHVDFIRLNMTLEAPVIRNALDRIEKFMTD